jgi:Rap1a immunity proteins
MRALRITIAVALALWIDALCTGEAEAENVSGNWLHEACQAPLESMDGGVCLGYVVGVEEMVHVVIAGVSAASTTFASGYCRPHNVTYRQLRDVVAAYLRHHPENRHEAAMTLVVRAVTTAWPCE